jgi:Mn2+/Fe2+ NRAMP family transporter
VLCHFIDLQTVWAGHPEYTAAGAIPIPTDAGAGAMADAMILLLKVPGPVFLIAFASFCALSEVFISYRRYVRILKWLTLALFAYVITLFMVQVPWGTALRGVVFPGFEPDAKSMTTIVAILGTTISPYLFFWQASQEAEEVQNHRHEHPLKEDPLEGRVELKRIELDTLAGMGASNLVALAIMMTAAATLNVHGITDIQTSAQAAAALRPIAGEYATLVFALGIVGTGLLAVPVLAGSAAYGLSEAIGRPVGLGRRPLRAIPASEQGRRAPAATSTAGAAHTPCPCAPRFRSGSRARRRARGARWGRTGDPPARPCGPARG